MKLPCIDCITLAVCRHKHYQALILGCIRINKYIFPYDHVDPNEESSAVSLPNMSDLYQYMKPTNWRLP